MPARMPLNSDNYVHVLAAENYRPYGFRATSVGGFEAWQRSFRPYLKQLLGIDKIEARGVCELLPRLISEVELEDHIREEWTIQTELGFQEAFFLLRPKRIEGPVPLVITPHGHGKDGKTTYAGVGPKDDGERDVALQAVREGYIAIAPDLRGYVGTRRREEMEKDQLSSCRALSLHAMLFERTLLGERVWDMMRLIDYASNRPDVDTNRIVITGNSGGGTISLFAAACDERISISIPSCYFCTFEASIGSIYHCDCNYVPGIMAAAEMYDVAGLIAPRPFLAVAGLHDPIFPYEAVVRSFEKLKNIYDVAGAPEKCQLYTGEGGHRYYKAEVWPFVKRWL